MYAYEAGATVFGHLLSIPEDMAADWPDTEAHLRLREVTALNEFSALIDGLERELVKKDPAHHRAAQHYAGLISVFFERQMTATTDNTGDQDNAAARLVAAYTGLVERGFRSKRGVADYAAALGVTPTHLTRCCKQTCNKSALAILNDRRHFEACMMLRETNVPVQMIAEDLGYSSPAYFSRAFQAQNGQSPSAFRKVHPSLGQTLSTTSKAL